MAAIAVGGFVALQVTSLLGAGVEEREHLEVARGVSLVVLSVGAFVLILSLRRGWFAHLDLAVGCAAIASFAGGAAYTAFVLHNGEAALALVLLTLATVWTFINDRRPAEPLRLSVGRFLFLMGRYSAAFLGGLGVAFLIIGPESPAGWVLTAVGAGFLVLSYVARRFILGDDAELSNEP